METAPVMMDDMVLFSGRGIKAYPAEERAKLTAQRIEQIAADPKIKTDSLTLVETAIRHRNRRRRCLVKLDKPVSTASHQKGAKITGLLNLALVVNGMTVAPQDSKVYGKVMESDGGRRTGNQKIVVQFTGLVIDDQLTPIMTDPIGGEGGLGRAVKLVGADTLTGAGVSGVRGAGTGALIGAEAALLAGGNHIQIPAGTVAEIVIKQPLEIK